MALLEADMKIVTVLTLAFGTGNFAIIYTIFNFLRISKDCVVINKQTM